MAMLIPVLMILFAVGLSLLPQGRWEPAFELISSERD